MTSMRRLAGPRCNRTAQAVASLIVAATILAGCLGGPGPEGADGTRTSDLHDLPAPPEALVPLAPGDAGLDVVERGNHTEYVFSLSDLSFRDAVFTYAIRAREDLRVGQAMAGQVPFDAWPEEGWFMTSGIVPGAPVEALFDHNATQRDVAEATTFRQRTLWIDQSRLRLTVRADGETVVDIAEDQPDLFIPLPGWSGEPEPIWNVSRGGWILVVMAAPSPKLGPDTVVEQRVVVTGPVDVYRLPPTPIQWGVGFRNVESSTLTVAAGFVDAAVGASVFHDTERSSFLHITTFGRGQGEGHAVFLDETHPIPVDGALALSSPRAGRIGFEVDGWTGAPQWYLTDAWLPTVPGS